MEGARVVLTGSKLCFTINRWWYPYLQTAGVHSLHLRKNRTVNACRGVEIKLLASWIWEQGEDGGYFLVSAALTPEDNQPPTFLPSLQSLFFLWRNSTTGGLDHIIVEVSRSHKIRHKSGRSPMNEAATYTTDTGDGHPYFQRDTNPRSQKPSGCRPSP